MLFRTAINPHVAPILAMAAVLAGCASESRQPLEPERTTEMPNAIEVSVSQRTLAVHFDPGETAPRPKDVAALNVLLATGDIVSGDEVRIERATSVIADARARALAGALARQGLRTTMAAPGGAPDGELRLLIEHAVATVPRCPNWTKPPGNDFENTLHSDFGCAVAIDLAAMVADPRDLVEGRPLAPVVGDAAIWPMNRYRTGAPEKPEELAPQPWAGATTFMATAPPKPEIPPGASDRPPAGAGGAGAAANGAASAAAALAPRGYSAPPTALPGPSQ
jgi:pilus assembly protein CpaD